MRKIDHTGQTYGFCEILGRGPEKKTWRTRCIRCGAEVIRSDSGVRGIRANAGMYRGCAACKHTYTERRDPVFGLRPKSEGAVTRDSGVRWLEAGGFETTPIGRMQQRFYLGVGLE
jgi:DNA-directed RNA polymerase subunit RPC12/RpoP